MQERWDGSPPWIAYLSFPGFSCFVLFGMVPTTSEGVYTACGREAPVVDNATVVADPDGAEIRDVLGTLRLKLRMGQSPAICVEQLSRGFGRWRMRCQLGPDEQEHATD